MIGSLHVLFKFGPESGFFIRHDVLKSDATVHGTMSIILFCLAPALKTSKFDHLIKNHHICFKDQIILCPGRSKKKEDLFSSVKKETLFLLLTHVVKGHAGPCMYVRMY
jgi:hypothetical protein